MARPTIGHLDPWFVDFMEHLKKLLRLTFQTHNALTFPVSAPGSAGMETCFVNLVEEGDKVLVCQNGVFGQRMIDIARRLKANVIILDTPWGQSVNPQQLREKLRQHPETKIVSFVHAETSTGALSDAKTLCSIIQEFDALSIVDAVTSLGGVPVKVDEWGIDAIYSGTQKCLSCPPGLSPVSFNEKAMEKIRQRTSPCPSWFLDLSLVQNYWQAKGQRTYHHTAPINLLYALHEALCLYHREGAEQVWQRHETNGRLLSEGLQELGFSPWVSSQDHMPQLHVVQLPTSLHDLETRQMLLRDFQLEIGGGLGELSGKVWRIGLMGHSSRKECVQTILEALAVIKKRS
jgi:alanine-glyoxylate transaminase/serine-glyoxylate transaminase/serine-pyruvate transaminase